ncbi:MAG: NAD-dependent epimerase/dehydratase family protein [Desulfurococcaceae archaeon]
MLITGGAGFIGGHLALYLESKGYDVIAVDNLERASMVSALRDAKIRLIVADLRDLQELPLADVIVHAAAYIDVAESFEVPYKYVVNNAAVTAKIAKAANERGVHVIYISSAAVYGEPHYIPVSEDHPANPISLYGLSKWMGEEIVAFYGRLGAEYTIIRPFNVYGPCQSKAYSGVILKFADRARRGLPPIIYGDGEQVRDFIHVTDLAKFIEIVINKSKVGVFNAGTGEGMTINKLARLVMDLAGITGSPVYEPPRRGDIKRSVADIRRALELGWSPSVKIEEGLRELLEKEC